METGEISYCFETRKSNVPMFLNISDQADDNTSSMKRLLHAKGDQIRDLVQQLETLKRGLYKNTAFQ